MAVIDCHHHVWWLDSFRTSFRRPGAQLNRDYTPDDLKVELRAAGIDGTILAVARQVGGDAALPRRRRAERLHPRGIGWYRSIRLRARDGSTNSGRARSPACTSSSTRKTRAGCSVQSAGVARPCSAWCSRRSPTRRSRWTPCSTPHGECPTSPSCSTTWAVRRCRKGLGAVGVADGRGSEVPQHQRRFLGRRHRLALAVVDRRDPAILGPLSALRPEPNHGGQ